MRSNLRWDYRYIIFVFSVCAVIPRKSEQKRGSNLKTFAACGAVCPFRGALRGCPQGPTGDDEHPRGC